MTTALPRQPMSAADYLAAERLAEHKHILWDGEVFAMAGASRVHNRLVAGVLRVLGQSLLGGPCAPYASDQRIQLQSARGRYVYPDVSVVCDPVQTDALDAETITNPRLLVEVLSDSTEAFDRGAKFLAYRAIPSLTDYLLVSQHAQRIEHYVRHDEASWTLRTYTAGSSIPIASLDVTLDLDAVYSGIELEPEPEIEPDHRT